MILALIVMSVFALSFLIILVLLLTGVITSAPATQNAQIEAALQALSNTQGWSVNTPSTAVNDQGESLGVCRVYQTFTQDVSQVSSLPSTAVTDIPADFQCLDDYSSALQLYVHTCNLAAGCVGYDGRLYSLGETESFFFPCGGLPPCTSENSSLVINFQTSGAQITSNSQCLNYVSSPNQVGFFNFVPCTSKTPSPSILLNIDQNPLPNGASLVRIRAPGTYSCLDSSLSLTECESMPSTGYIWFINPQIPLTQVPNYQNNILPSRVSLLPPGGIPADITFLPQTPDQYSDLLTFGAVVQSLDNRNGTPSFSSLTPCPTVCPQTTVILPASQWSLVGR
jgi:hypothetical protein